MTIKVNDTVVMSAAVIKRCGHSEFTRNFKGIVKIIIGNTADVETLDGIRSVPLANLKSMKAVPDIRTGKSPSLILDV